MVFFFFFPKYPHWVARCGRGDTTYGRKNWSRKELEPISNIISNKLVLKCVDFAPPKRGQPMYVPDAVTTAVLD